MTFASSVSRRRFLRLSSSLPLSAALVSGMARSAFAAPALAKGATPAGAAKPVAILDGNEYFAGPTPAAVEAMHRVSLVGNRYLNSDTADFSKRLRNTTA